MSVGTLATSLPPPGKISPLIEENCAARSPLLPLWNTGTARAPPISTNLILSYVAEHVLGMPRSF